MGYKDFFSFVKGIQNGYSSKNYPVLSKAELEKEYQRVFSRFSFSYDGERDILRQLLRGEIDRWEAIAALEDEVGLSYDEACRKTLEFQRGIGSAVDKRRKKSKYHGAVVNNTFDEAPAGTGSVGGLPMATSSHPSIRYFVVNYMIHSSKRDLVKSSLSGSLDTFLLQNYCAGLGRDDPGPNIKDVGDNGHVVLNFDTNSGHSTEVDLGGSLETGYVVESIDDELGLFPEGTVDGDFLEREIVQKIIRSQGERDKRYEMG